MLKVNLTVAEFSALSDEFKAEYKVTTDGTYKLDLGEGVFTTDKDPAGLMSALEKERSERARLKEIADKFEAEKKQAELEGLKSAEDIKKHFQEELDRRDALAKKEREEQLAEIKAQKEANANRLASEQALKLATELFGTNAALMLPHVQQRMKGVLDSEGNSVVNLIDPATGQPLLDQNLDNFSKSLSTNDLFKDMVVVSNASGGRANDSETNSGSTSTAKKLKDYGSDELLAMKKSDPEKFKQLISGKG